MASFVYDQALAGFLLGSFDMATATVTLALVQITGSGTPYTANQGSDQFFNVIPSGAVASRSAALTSKTTSNGIFGAANSSFPTVTFGQPCGAMVLYIDTGSDATSPLIAYLDASNYSGLPISPNGSTITVSFSATGKLIFSL